MASTKRRQIIVFIVVVMLTAAAAIYWFGRQIGYNIDRSKSDTILEFGARSLEVYLKEHGHYPTADEFAGLVDIGWWSDANDYWGNPYIYEPPLNEGDTFTLRSLGRDGKPGGEGLDADITNHDVPRN